MKQVRQYNQLYNIIKLSSTLQDSIPSFNVQYIYKQCFISTYCKAIEHKVEIV